MKDGLCQAAAAAAELLIATAFPHIIKSETMAIQSNPWGWVGLGIQKWVGCLNWRWLSGSIRHGTFLNISAEGSWWQTTQRKTQAASAGPVRPVVWWMAHAHTSRKIYSSYIMAKVLQSWPTHTRPYLCVSNNAAKLADVTNMYIAPHFCTYCCCWLHHQPGGWDAQAQ